MREMEVWITADSLEKKRGYSGARLTLPAGREAIRDAMQRAHVQENESYQVEYTSGWPEFLVRILEGQTKCRLDEINLLAYQLSRMAQEQMDTMEGAIALRIEEDVGSPVTMKEVINFTYNLDCYDFHPGVIDDEDLGEICIDGGMLELFKKLPDDVWNFWIRKRLERNFAAVIREPTLPKDMYLGARGSFGKFMMAFNARKSQT